MPSYPFVAIFDEWLHRRAWVMQESILSARRLDIASSQIHWFCRSACRREGFPDRGLNKSFPPDGRELFRMPLRTEPLDQTIIGLEMDGPLSWWYRTLYASYVRRGIAMHKDLLPAIAGVAEKIAERTAYHYKAGLWLEDIHRGLLWQASYTVARPAETSCPSWSWASTNVLWFGGDRTLFPCTYESGPRATILDVTVINTDNNLFGEATSASLALRDHYRTFDHWTDEHCQYITPNVGRRI